MLFFFFVVLVFVHTVASQTVTVKYVGGLTYPVINSSSPGSADNQYGYEGGTVIKVNGVYHLFTAEMIGFHWVKMRLGYWTSPDRETWTRNATIYESSGNYNGTDPRAALWGPMPFFDDSSTTWLLVYVAYRCAPNNSSGWYGNYDGTIWLAKSTVPGMEGIGGPYEDIGIILEPGKDSQPWEGLQGTDSFFMYKVGTTYVGFYGSAQSQRPQMPFYWNVGLANSSSPFGPWLRMPNNPINFNNAYAENPIVFMVNETYLVIFDDLDDESCCFGLSYSKDGYTWAPVINVEVPGGVRTPLGLIQENDTLFSLFFTRVDSKGYENVWAAEVQLSVVV